MAKQEIDRNKLAQKGEKMGKRVEGRARRERNAMTRQNIVNVRCHRGTHHQ